MSNKQALIDEMKAHLSAARTVTDAVIAAGRDYTEMERTTVADYLAKSERIKKQLDQLKCDEAVKAAITDFGNQLAGKTSAANTKAPDWANRRGGTSPWVKSTMERFSKLQAVTGSKALLSGTVGMPSPIATDVTRIAQYPARLLDLLINRRAIPTNPYGDTPNTFSFLRQTVRTTNAAPVADAALKPTSVYTFTEIEDRVRVIAHLSEAIPERLLSDYRATENFLRSEMEEGLYRVVETQVVNGSGAGENLRGILNTSGILVQAWDSDLLTTLRGAITAMAVVGEQPNAWAIHPSDVAVLDLLQDNEARHYWNGPQQQLTTAPVWSLPVVQTLAVPTGTAILGDWNLVELVVREDAKFDIDRSGDNFTHNLAVARLEGRFGVGVLRPSAFCSVDLTV